jgi:replicative DNA helicase
VPPHSREAEEAVLGGILIDNSVLSLVTTKIHNNDDFYADAHQRIYSSMLKLAEDGQLIDMITLGAALKESKVFDQVGGCSYLATLIDATPSVANIGKHAGIVADKALVRRTVRAASDVAARGYENPDDTQDYLDAAEKALLEACRTNRSVSAVRASDVAAEVFQEIQDAAQRGAPMMGCTTGFDQLDRMLSGLHGGDLIIVAARPSMGKTALALNIGQRSAARENRHVLLFSLEMGREQLVRRLLSMVGRIDAQTVRRGTPTADDWLRLVEAQIEIGKQPLWIEDGSALSVGEVRSKARRHHMTHGLDLIIVDYLQLMRGSKKSDVREQEVAEISRGLKALAKELNVPVIALAQLNRSLESRDNKRPRLSDLRESGSIEQDADVVLFIYRDEVYHKETEEKGIAEIIIGKQRNGPIGTICLRWTEEFTRFDSLCRGEAA